MKKFVKIIVNKALKVALLSTLATFVALSLTLQSIRALPLAEEAEVSASYLTDGKSEVVYAKLDGHGGVMDVFVVNRFPSQPGETIYDYGAYAEVHPLSLNGSLSHGEGTVSISTGEAPFYYQGHLADAELPWIFALTYMLDGIPTEAAALSGASGILAIELNVKSNPAARDAKDGSNPWADAAMVQISVNLPGKTVQELRVDNGSLAEAGSNHVVNFMVMPGTAESVFTIQANVKNFYMPAIQIAAVPFNMNLDGLDLPEFQDNEEIANLKDGTGQLASGSSELAEGVGQLQSAAVELQIGLASLTAGGNTLAAGGGDLADGVKDFSNGLGQLAQGSKPLRDGVAKTASGAAALSDGLQAATGGLTQYTDGVAGYVGGVDQLLGGIPALGAGADQVAQGAAAYAAGLGQLGGGADLLTASKQIKDSLAAMASGLAEGMGTPEEMAAQQAMLSNLGTQAAALAAGSTQFKAGLAEIVTQLSSGLDGLAQAAGGLSDGLSQIIFGLENQVKPDPANIIAAAGLTPEALANPDVQALLAYMATQQQTQTTGLVTALRQLHDSGDPSKPAPAQALVNGLSALKTAVAQMDGMYDELDTGIQQLAAALPQLAGLSGVFDLGVGIQQLSDGYTSFDDGLNAYVVGVSQINEAFKSTQEQPDLYTGILGLQSGLGQLATGAGQLGEAGKALTATAELNEGQEQLNSGLKELSTGLKELSAGVSSYTKGVDELAANGGSLRDGVKSYTSGTADVMSGLGQWASGFDQYVEGLGQTSEGAYKLADGAKKLDDGTSTMDKRIQEMMDELLADYQKEGEPMPSFASAKNTDVEQVQFVIMTQAIPEKTLPVPPAEATAPESFWDRIRNLFG